MNRKTVAVAVALVAQVVAIGWLVARYERVVSQGVEVRFPCRAYDPCDPLRGRYLRTRVEETCTNITCEVDMKYVWRKRNGLAVRIEPTASNGLWRVAEVAKQPTAEGVWIKDREVRFDYRMGYSAKREDESYADFEKRRKASGITARVELPDQLFVNEKVAPEAEKVLNEHAGKSSVAVYRVLNGQVVITDIEIEGRPILQLVRER